MIMKMAKILDYRDESDPKQWGRLGGRRRHAEDPLRMVTEEENHDPSHANIFVPIY